MKKGFTICLAFTLLFSLQISAQTDPAETQKALDLVKGLYSLVSANSGDEVDWDAVRSVFLGFHRTAQTISREVCGFAR